jgi:hypothetical protein
MVLDWRFFSYDESARLVNSRTFVSVATLYV